MGQIDNDAMYGPKNIINDIAFDCFIIILVICYLYVNLLIQMVFGFNKIHSAVAGSCFGKFFIMY
ncbi:hypothetical protein DCC39_03335 [Pueribacillus theae]|uniref:Uncharacterized protein n=1 Tax=Pueribacillus theae TaxID=2171751 RepID=A0A2U1K5V3_9BACI|nr:hypothetical protein DCC39_03335 [Pueribacillus theae]